MAPNGASCPEILSLWEAISACRDRLCTSPLIQKLHLHRSEILKVSLSGAHGSWSAWGRFANQPSVIKTENKLRVQQLPCRLGIPVIYGRNTRGLSTFYLSNDIGEIQGCRMVGHFSFLFIHIMMRWCIASVRCILKGRTKFELHSLLLKNA